MAGQMNIRDAGERDIEAIADIYRHYVRTNICTVEEHEPSTETLRAEFAHIFSLASPFIVATDSNTGDICGYAYIGPFNPRSGYNTTCEDSIYVHPDHCGKSIGKLLLRALLEKLKTTSKTTQVIAKMSILPQQAVDDLPSCRLHMSFGFKLVGRLVKIARKFDKWIDVVILQLDLEKSLVV